MPTIVILGKLKVQVFADDHNPPHFHAVTPDHEALIRISDLQILQGQIARRDYERLLDWASSNENRGLLEDAWKRLNQR